MTNLIKIPPLGTKDNVTGSCHLIPTSRTIFTQGEDRLEDYAIHESQNAYNAVLTLEKWVLRGENTVFWSDSVLTTDS